MNLETCHTPGTPPHQRGFAMVISIIFLTALTALGVGAMRNSAIEERLSANIQHHNSAFRVAEAGLSIGLGDASDIAADPNAAESGKRYLVNIREGGICDTSIQADCGDWPEAERAEVVVTTAYSASSKVPPPGFSLDGDFATHHFRVRGEARYGLSRADLTRGFRRPGPRP